MFRPGTIAICFTLLFLAGPNATAQRGRRYYNESTYARLGLEAAWTTQIQFDSLRTATGQIDLQIVGLSSFEALQATMLQVFQVDYGDQSRRFRENDLDAAGRAISRDEARRLAEKFVIQLSARGVEGKLQVIQVPQTILYVQSSRGTLQAMDAESGQTLWSAAIGLPTHPSMGSAANETYVATINGSRLYLLDRKNGEILWDREIQMNPDQGLAMSDRFIFVPCTNGQVEVYQLPDEESDHRGAPPRVFRANSGISAVPLVTPRTVSWGTDQGQMLVADLVDGPTMLYRHQTSGAILGQAVFLPPDQLVIASADGYVSRLNELDGRISWTISTGGQLKHGPLVQADQLYVTTVQNELFCVGAEDGLERWMVGGIEQVIACGKDRVYARGQLGLLVALDKSTGARVGSLPLNDYRTAFQNHWTDRIYLASSDGTLLCLRELNAIFPTILRPLPTEKQADDASEAGGATRRNPGAVEPPPAPGPDTPDAGDDPFADPSDAGDAAEPAAGSDEPAEDAQDEPTEDAPADEPTAEDDPFGFG